MLKRVCLLQQQLQPKNLQPNLQQPAPRATLAQKLATATARLWQLYNQTSTNKPNKRTTNQNVANININDNVRLPSLILLIIIILFS